MAVRKRKIDVARVRSRLYNIVLDGDDKEAVSAARVLLNSEPAQNVAESRADPEYLAAIREALHGKGL